MGVVVDGYVIDITALFDTRPPWPLPPGDWIVSQLPNVLPRLTDHLDDAARLPVASVRLESPVANPGKIVGAPINYKAHIDEARADQAIAHGRDITDLA